VIGAGSSRLKSGVAAVVSNKLVNVVVGACICRLKSGVAAVVSNVFIYLFIYYKTRTLCTKANIVRKTFYKL